MNLGIFYTPQIYDMRSTALLPLQRKACWGSFRPKNPTASAAFEPANLGIKGQHATPRPPKPSLTIYRTQKFITAFTSARHMSLSWARSIQFMPLHLSSCRSILLLSSHLGLCLPSGPFPSGLPAKNLFAPPLPPYVTHVPPVSFILNWSPE